MSKDYSKALEYIKDNMDMYFMFMENTKKELQSRIDERNPFINDIVNNLMTADSNLRYLESVSYVLQNENVSLSLKLISVAGNTEDGTEEGMRTHSARIINLMDLDS